MSIEKSKAELYELMRGRAEAMINGYTEALELHLDEVRRGENHASLIKQIEICAQMLDVLDYVLTDGGVGTMETSERVKAMIAEAKNAV